MDHGHAPERNTLTPEERAGIRAYLQRCEVRLSTVHRIATGLLSGAGLLVVLPVVARDAVSGILRSLVQGGLDVSDALLVVAVGMALAVPAVSLWLLFADLTRFFFHANHLGGDGAERFTPRFTLTSLHLPSDELGPTAAADLQAAREDGRTVELLVPTNDASRRRIDRQLDLYGMPGRHAEGGVRDDLDRVAGLSALAAARPRPLLDEVAKVEHGLTRHILRLRGLVLRYVKALLALLTTALAVYACDAVMAGLPPDTGVDDVRAMWIAGIVIVWAPLVVLAVTSPIRWVEELMREDGAPATPVAGDPELTVIERVSIRIALVAATSAGVAMVVGLLADGTSTTARIAGATTLAGAVAVFLTAALTGRLRNLTRV